MSTMARITTERQPVSRGSQSWSATWKALRSDWRARIETTRLRCVTLRCIQVLSWLSGCPRGTGGHAGEGRCERGACRAAECRLQTACRQVRVTRHTIHTIRAACHGWKREGQNERPSEVGKWNCTIPFPLQIIVRSTVTKPHTSFSGDVHFLDRLSQPPGVWSGAGHPMTVDRQSRWLCLAPCFSFGNLEGQARLEIGT
ncbi:hypothetical protein B0T22DRAFT_297023 [Podospora appendiculata]|uniref:Uncharacterized protein n=1 Tax=Podospora appendiculata TaxID=314037 RepID=A0AAE0X1Z3_9PEZI|nr:hypothetical protein B0T22DRAFT_297023 [Podospora appendiculata]